MSLATIPHAHSVKVAGVRDGAMSTRLMELGLIEGAEVCVLRRAPLGDPLHVRVGDYELSIRATEADLIDVHDA